MSLKHIFFTVVFSLLLGAAQVFAYGPSNALCWDHPQNGLPTSLAGFKVHAGTVSGQYTNLYPFEISKSALQSNGITRCVQFKTISRTFPPTDNGRVFLAMTASDIYGKESVLSVEFSFDYFDPDAVPPPIAPSAFQIK